MASTNADANSLRNTARAARSKFMAPTFRIMRFAAPAHSARDHVAEPIADAAKHDHVDREHSSSQQRHLLLEGLSLPVARGRIARAKAALDEAHERSIDQRRQYKAADRAEEPGQRKIDHAASSS